MILTHFLSLVGEWRPVFRQTRTTAMAVCMALSVLCVLDAIPLVSALSFSEPTAGIGANFIACLAGRSGKVFDSLAR